MAERNILQLLRNIVDKDGQSVSVDSLRGNIFGLYFSAHWCGPCRKFTPLLAKKYKEIKDAGHHFEIVFVSADENEETAQEYFASMPWKMVSYEDRALEEILSSTVQVQGIPTLALIDGEGNVITDEGAQLLLSVPFEELLKVVAQQQEAQRKIREEVAAFKSGFHPAGFFASKGIVGKDNIAVPASALEGKVIGLYFSAHWCPPCRAFTPVLSKKYNELTSAGKQIEIIFISSDQGESDFNEYFREMPWKTLPFSDRSTKEMLSSVFEVEGIPTLILLNPDGSVLSSDGRSHIMSKEFSDSLA